MTAQQVYDRAAKIEAQWNDDSDHEWIADRLQELIDCALALDNTIEPEN